MTQALKELLAKVEAGDLHYDRQLYRLTNDAGLPEERVWGAYQSGSLDAAKALHDALLPGWGGAAGFDHYVGYSISRARVSHMGIHHNAQISSPFGDPARAWLIAILKAKIAETENEPQTKKPRAISDTGQWSDEPE